MYPEINHQTSQSVIPASPRNILPLIKQHDRRLLRAALEQVALGPTIHLGLVDARVVAPGPQVPAALADPRPVVAGVAVRAAMDDDGVQVVDGVLLVAAEHALGQPLAARRRRQERAKLRLVVHVAVPAQVQVVEGELHREGVLQRHLGRVDRAQHLDAEQGGRPQDEVPPPLVLVLAGLARGFEDLVGREFPVDRGGKAVYFAATASSDLGLGGGVGDDEGLGLELVRFRAARGVHARELLRDDVLPVLVDDGTMAVIIG